MKGCFRWFGIALVLGLLFGALFGTALYVDVAGITTPGTITEKREALRAIDDRITAKSDPVAVTVGGLPGYRYRYTYTTADKTVGVHDHYFLFKTGRLVQLVLQAVPATNLKTLQPTFDRIVHSFQAPRS